MPAAGWSAPRRGAGAARWRSEAMLRLILLLRLLPVLRGLPFLLRIAGSVWLDRARNVRARR